MPEEGKMRNKQENNGSDINGVSMMELKELVDNLEDRKILVVEWREEDEF